MVPDVEHYGEFERSDDAQRRSAAPCSTAEIQLKELSQIINAARKRITASEAERMPWLVELSLSDREYDRLNAITKRYNAGGKRNE